MFIGIVPREARLIITELLRKIPKEKEIWVGCSGNFTVDKLCAQMGRIVHSNDVSLYSKIIADISLGVETEMSVVVKEYKDVFDKWAEHKYKKLVMVMFVANVCDFGVLMFADNKLFGFCSFSKFLGTKNKKHIFLQSDFVVNSTTKKLSKLILWILRTKDVKRILMDKYFYSYTGMQTSVYTSKRVSMKYRGVFALPPEGEGQTNIHSRIFKRRNKKCLHKMDGQEINKKLEEINAASDYKFIYISPNDLVFLDKNARYMSKDQLDRLTHNIKQDQFLTQLPLCMKRSDGSLLILSGNHRVKAAIKAELDFIMVQYIEEVDKDKWLALQLSHNSIVGQDDMVLLAELYGMIQELDGKEYSGINEQEIRKYEELPIASINEDGIRLHEVGFVFNDLNLQNLDNTILSLRTYAERQGDKDKRFAGVDFYEFIDVMSDIKDRSGIKNHTVAFMKMLEISKVWIKEQDKLPQDGEQRKQ